MASTIHKIRDSGGRQEIFRCRLRSNFQASVASARANMTWPIVNSAIGIGTRTTNMCGTTLRGMLALRTSETIGSSTETTTEQTITEIRHAISGKEIGHRATRVRFSLAVTSVLTSKPITIITIRTIRATTEIMITTIAVAAETIIVITKIITTNDTGEILTIMPIIIVKISIDTVGEMAAGTTTITTIMEVIRETITIKEETTIRRITREDEIE